VAKRSVHGQSPSQPADGADMSLQSIITQIF